MGRGAAHMEKLLMSHCHLRPSCLKVEADASAPAFTLAATETASTTTMIQRYFQNENGIQYFESSGASLAMPQASQGNIWPAQRMWQK